MFLRNLGNINGHWTSLPKIYEAKLLINWHEICLESLFKELGFKHSSCYDLMIYDKRFGYTKINSLNLYGRHNFHRWIDNVGFSNQKFLRKVEKFEKDGICPHGY